MNSFFLHLTSYALNAIWQIPFFWAAGWGISRCLKRAGPEFAHKLWVAILILATVVPATPILRSYFGDDAEKGNASSRAMVVTESGSDLAPVSRDIVFPSGVVYLVSGFYIATLLFFALRLARVIRSTIALVSNARPAAPEPEWVALWQKSKETFSVQEASLLRSTDVRGPAAAGFRYPVLLLPDTFFENHSSTEFQAAVGHECAHIQRNDFRKNVSYEVLSLFTAFHPVTWAIKSQIAQTREMICDRMAADRLLSPQSYAQSLLQLASKMPPAMASVSHAVGMFDTHTLERRIMTLTTSQRRLGRLRSHLSGWVAALLLLVCTAASWTLAQSVAAQTPRSTVSDAVQTRLGREDLTCTYYGGEKGGLPGTCWLDENEKNLYRCYLNENPLRTNLQSACEWKVQRALKANK